MTQKRLGIALGLATLGLLAGMRLAQAEEPLGVPTDIEKAFRGTDATIKILLAKDVPSDKEKLELKNAARYLVWRATWPTYLDNPDKMATVLKDFRDFKNREMREKDMPNTPALKYFNAELADSFKAVFDRKFDGNRVSSVNAAQLLPIAARTKSTELSDYLTALIKDAGKHDALKLYAVRALKEYFPVRPIGPNSVRVPKDVEPDIKRIQVLTEYIERKWKVGGSKEETDAVCYLRREAVHALAQTQVPAAIVKAKVDGEVVMVLLKVLAKDKMDPAPTLAEKCEAAIGLCNLKLLETPDYQAQLGIYAAGIALSDFINGYREDYANLEKKKPGKLPYKVLGERWKLGLEKLVENTSKDAAANAVSKGLNDRAKVMLDSVITHKSVDNQQAVDFRTWVMGQKSTIKPLYKFGKPLTIDLGY